MRELLEQNNLHFDFMLTQEDLVNQKKDLRVVADNLKLDLQESALIDDSLAKKIQGQNFIHIQSFDPNNQ